jgi:hypothetical protein
VEDPRHKRSSVWKSKLIAEKLFEDREQRSQARQEEVERAK